MSRVAVVTGGTRGIAGDRALPAVLADDVAALAERMNVAVDRPDFPGLHARQHHELKVDRQEVLTDNVQLRTREKVVDVGHAPGDRILDGNHRQLRLPLPHRIERLLEARRGHGDHLRIVAAAGEMRIRPGLALEGDGAGRIGHFAAFHWRAR